MKAGAPAPYPVETSDPTPTVTGTGPRSVLRWILAVVGVLVLLNWPPVRTRTSVDGPTGEVSPGRASGLRKPHISPSAPLGDGKLYRAVDSAARDKPNRSGPTADWGGRATKFECDTQICVFESASHADPSFAVPPFEVVTRFAPVMTGWYAVTLQSGKQGLVRSRDLARLRNVPPVHLNRVDPDAIP